MELKGATEYTLRTNRSRAGERAQCLGLAYMTRCVNHACPAKDVNDGSHPALGEKGARILIGYVKQQKPTTFSPVGKQFSLGSRFR
jgi:hypothetical protein